MSVLSWETFFFYWVKCERDINFFNTYMKNFIYKFYTLFKSRAKIKPISQLFSLNLNNSIYVVKSVWHIPYIKFTRCFIAFTLLELSVIYGTNLFVYSNVLLYKNETKFLYLYFSICYLYTYVRHKYMSWIF